MTAPRPEPPALHDRALQDLSFIRRTMEGAASFTDVPGWGLVALGVIAVVAAGIANLQTSPERWLAVWTITAALGATVGSAAMLHKMRHRLGYEGSLSFSVPTRKFLFSLWPSIITGAVLTLALIDPFTPGIDARIVDRVIPGVWLLLYGMGVTTAGTFSIRAVPLMGFGFIALGVLSLFLPFANGNVMMALGFGGLQTAFGVYIARRHGG
jgi:hypothetical protein